MVDRCLKLITEQPLARPLIKAWFNTVVENGPSGVVQAVTVSDDDRERHVVRLIHQTAKHSHRYLIPLARDLLDDEIDRIVAKFALAHPDLDFNVETNETTLRASDQTVELAAADQASLALALAKQQHESWVKERSEAGWRYGTTFDQRAKTHPLLQPWEHLPERYRLADPTWPDRLMDMLNDHGYVVLPRPELEAMLQSVQHARR